MHRFAADLCQYVTCVTDSVKQISAVADESARATHCVTANVLQTKVDAQCDKLATELGRQRLRRWTFSSYSELFVEIRQF